MPVASTKLEVSITVRRLHKTFWGMVPMSRREAQRAMRGVGNARQELCIRVRRVLSAKYGADINRVEWEDISCDVVAFARTGLQLGFDSLPVESAESDEICGCMG